LTTDSHLSPLPSLISPDVNLSLLAGKPPLKLGILASGSGSNFEVIAQAIAAHELNAQIQVLIYNNPTAGVIARAERWGVKSVLINHRQFANREDCDHQIVATLKEYDAELIVMAGWMRVVTKVFIDAFPHQIINIHPSLLPSFRGVKAVEQALAAKVKISGCTVHLLSVEVDAGPILIQAAVPILENDTAETLHARIQVQEHLILPQAIALVGHRLEN
jgi:phosphoribosylglycinamide formyltransferase-1